MLLLLAALTAGNCVIEHVVSRPAGDNSYRNVVAACRQCNNRKGNSDAEDFLRVLYREGFLSGEEFEQRASHLQRLRAGELRPGLSPAPNAEPSAAADRGRRVGPRAVRSLPQAAPAAERGRSAPW